MSPLFCDVTRAIDYIYIYSRGCHQPSLCVCHLKNNFPWLAPWAKIRNNKIISLQTNILIFFIICAVLSLSSIVIGYSLFKYLIVNTINTVPLNSGHSTKLRILPTYINLFTVLPKTVQRILNTYCNICYLSTKLC
jgi:hypothetical protein